MRKPLLIGHRGAAGLAPENTLVSIKKAMELRVNRIEIDVHLTKDNVPVVIHDNTLSRTTNGSGFIKRKAFEDLQKLSAGIKFSSEFNEEKIPSLQQVLECINGKVELQIEVKHGSKRYPGIEKAVLDLIDRFNGKKWCFINSFDTRVLKEFYSLDSTCILHKLFVLRIPVVNAHIDRTLSSGTLNRYHYVSEFGVNYKYVTRSLIEDIHNMGKRINVWTPNDIDSFKRLAEMGVDGIITDRPDVFNSLFS
ncbi:MAG: glycerophosphodiester phosphodiesterase [Flavobacteriales bacterium]|nr:glycerophosphodiester phosphodiesterase [Flavobacteriales bacterium]